MVEEHLLGQRRALAERKELQHLVFLAGEVDPLTVNFDGLGIEIDLKVARLDDGLCMAFGAAHDGVDSGDELVLVERFRHVVVGAKAQAANLILDLSQAGEDQDGRGHLGHTQHLQNLVAAHIRQIEVE